jgi:hypothetical protein
VIPAHGYFLIGGAAYTENPMIDAKLSSGITDAASLTLNQSGAVVDALCFYVDAASQGAFGPSFHCEGTPVPNLPHTNQSTPLSNVDASLERKPGGASGACTDTGDNASDFSAKAPADPQSSTSP